MGAGPNVKVLSLGISEWGSALGAGVPVAHLGGWASGLGFWVEGVGFRIRVFGLRVLGFGSWVSGLGLGRRGTTSWKDQETCSY